MTTPDATEAVARAIALIATRHIFPEADQTHVAKWADFHWRDYVVEAQAAIAAHLDALKSAGFVVVPREPSEAMLEASWSNTTRTTVDERMACELGDSKKAHMLKMRRRYRAMIEARKPLPNRHTLRDEIH